MDEPWIETLRAGTVIPACPLALNNDRQWSERHQRALAHYYRDAGAKGIAVGVHTTQFAIREYGLYRPVLAAVADVMSDHREGAESAVHVAGICGDTAQACMEAELARSIGYHAGLLTTNAVRDRSESDILAHCRSIAEVIPVFGFYLHPAVGGRTYSYRYWREFCEIENVVAIKIAAFNRYQTIDVIRAVIASGRDDIALYTGNDDNIINDLITPYRMEGQERWFTGGLLGQWAVWTKAAVNMLQKIHAERRSATIATDWLAANIRLTDANAAIFDAANQFAGCIPGVNEMLRRQGLLPSSLCLDETEVLSPGQAEELDRISQINENDDAFITENLARWLEN